MTRTSQKDAELRSVLAFKRAYREFPEGSVDSSEEPLDVKVLLADGKCLGVEVTEFVRDRSDKGSALNAHQRLARSIVEAAEKVYRDLGGPPVFASVSFVNPFKCRSTEVQSWAKQIGAEVAREAVRLGAGVEIHGWEVGLPSGIDRITVYPLGGTHEGQFSVTYSGPYDNLTEQQITQILEEKESSMKAYRAKCDELWLLILIEGVKLSAWAQLSAEAECRVYATSFDRVFLLFDNTRVVRLKTTAA